MVLCHGATSRAQEAASSPPPNDVAALRQQVQALADMVTTLQQQVKDQQATLAKMNTGPTTAAPAPSAAPAASAAPLFPTEDQEVVASAQPTPIPGAVTASAPAATSSTQFPTTDASVTTSTDTLASSSGAGAALTAPMTIAGTRAGGTYMNISFDGQFALAYSSDRNLDRLEVGDHDPLQRGFNARNLELALDGAVDPYFEGFANIVLKLDNDNQTEIEAEEAFLQTTALRGVGAQVSWTAPVSWYSQFLFGLQNGRGNTGYSFRNPGADGTFFGRVTTDRELRGVQDFVFVPRWENSFDLSPTQTVLGGVSGAFGPNETGGNARTEIYGADFLYKWKSPRAEGGFPFVKWQTEAMYRRFEAGRGVDQSFPVAETFHDWGMYSQVVWGFTKGWTTGLRGDYLHMQNSAYTDALDRQSRERVSADLTWYPTEFSKLRLQYNHDFLEANDFLSSRQADSIFFQFEFILGAHGAHKF